MEIHFVATICTYEIVSTKIQAAWILAPKGFNDDGVFKWRQGKARSLLGPRSIVRRFSMEARGKRRTSRAEALAPHAAASKGSSARPSVSAPPLFPRTIYIMYDHDVPLLWPERDSMPRHRVRLRHTSPPCTLSPGAVVSNHVLPFCICISRYYLPNSS